MKTARNCSKVTPGAGGVSKKMMRVVVVLNKSDEVLAAYPIEIAEPSQVSDDAFLLAARRMAERDRRVGKNPSARFVIAPPANMPV